MTVKHVLYWDIDGTLLTTNRGGVPALEDGAAAVLGRRPDLAHMATAGLTDRMIARRILESHGDGFGEEAVLRLLDVYATSLPGRLAGRTGRVLPGVMAALNDLAARTDTANVLVTGNVRAGADAKLRTYGLDHHFDLGGFAEDGEDRADIARAAVARAQERYGPASLTGVLIGDTPYDVHAGREVGLRVIAVASDPRLRRELEAAQPWWLVDEVPAADQILARMSAADIEAS